ncbi:MAG: hypothetical protein R2712_03125 [Vicinamibacterales bacterium]
MREPAKGLVNAIGEAGADGARADALLARLQALAEPTRGRRGGAAGQRAGQRHPLRGGGQRTCRRAAGACGAG